MFRSVVAVAVAAGAFVSVAQAEPFQGPYAGVAATLDNVQGSGDAEGLGISGPGASGFVGYNFSLGGGFAGLEANIDLNTADEDVTGVEAKWGWGIGARAGLLVNDNTAAYGRVGYQRNKVGADGFGSTWGDGVRIGGGIETAVSESLNLRAEFNHVNYEADLVNNQFAIGLVFGF